MQHCAHCFDSTPSFECGNRCGALYCSKQCAQQDWSNHTCKIQADLPFDAQTVSTAKLALQHMTKPQLFELAQEHGIEVRDRGIQVLYLKMLPRKEELIERILEGLKRQGKLDEDRLIVGPTTTTTGPYKDIISVMLRNADFATLLTSLQAFPALYRIESQNPAGFWKSAFQLYFPEYLFAIREDNFERLPHNDANGPRYFKLCAWITWGHRRVLKTLQKTTNGTIKMIETADGYTSIQNVEYLGRVMPLTTFALLNGYPYGALLARKGTGKKHMDFEDAQQARTNAVMRYYLAQKLAEREKYLRGATSIKSVDNFFAFMEEMCMVDAPENTIQAAHWKNFPVTPTIEKDGRDIISVGQEL